MYTVLALTFFDFLFYLLICRYTKRQQAGLLQESNNQEVTRSELCCPQVSDGVSMFGE